MSGPPLVLGHRGASAAAPENTLEAFALARELGADGVELDVRRTADDVLVVHHDAVIEEFGLVVERSYADLRAARPDVPTLAEALATCRGLLVNVEVKCCAWDPDPDPPGRPVLRATVDAIRAAAADVVVSSFDLDAIDACRELAPELVTAWLTSGQSPAAAAAVAAPRGHRWIHPDWGTVLASPAQDVAAAHEAGCLVDVWTVNDPAAMLELVARGVDGIITDVPDVAIANLR
ncbi:MAG: glycerophosphodiester phosphodiesterase [Actinomycetota bacterium]